MGDAIAEVCLHIRTYWGNALADTLGMAFDMRIERANERESERACLICTWHAAFIHVVTNRISIRDRRVLSSYMSHSICYCMWIIPNVMNLYARHASFIYVFHASFVRVPWRFHKFDTAHSCVRHDPISLHDRRTGLSQVFIMQPVARSNIRCVCVCVCVCVWVSECVCVYVCMCLYSYVCVCVRERERKIVCVCACLTVCVHVWLCVCVFMCV